ncbi:MAG: potassium channel family protein [Desulfovibrionales bacterium]
MADSMIRLIWQSLVASASLKILFACHLKTEEYELLLRQNGGSMNVLFLVLGVVLLALAVIDLLWTTLWVDGGAGPLSSRVSTWLWHILQKVSGRRSRALSLAGPLMLVTSLCMWVVLLWAGWTFCFAGGDVSLIDARDNEPVTWPGRIYFVAFTMFTMGNGDFYPKDGFWQIVTGLTTANGMLVVTLAISYVLSVLSAVSQKRSFASGVTGLGMQSISFVEKGWDGNDFHSLELPLSSLALQLDRLADQHKTYPILHYYHSEKSDTASAIAVAVFDDALTILNFGVPEKRRPSKAVLTSARSSVESYLQTLNSAFIKPAPDTPIAPNLERLRSKGIPTLDDAAFDEILARLENRRRKLLGMVRADAWSWPLEKS